VLENCNAGIIILPAIHDCGGMAEWSMAAVLKTVRGASPSWVRILLPPPIIPHYDNEFLRI
jgi:hypothetical protein